MQEFFHNNFISVFIIIISLYMAFRLLVLKDVNLLIGKSGKKVKDEEKYVRAGGLLVLAFSAMTIITTIVEQYSIIAGIILIILTVIGLLVGWVQIEKKYGDVKKK